MKETGLTFLQKAITRLLVVVMLMTIYSISAYSQCSLGCNSQIQVSLDNATCSATITPAMMLGTVPPASCPAGSFSVEVRVNGKLVPGAIVTAEHIGKVLEVKVIDAISGNSCWGYATVEDKLKPVINCVNPADIKCYQTETYRPTVTENCGIYTLAITSEDIKNNNCDGTLPNNILKVVKRTFVATDKSGNRSEPCTITFNVKTLDSLKQITFPTNKIFPTSNLECDANYRKDSNGNPHPTVTGVPMLDTFKLWPTQLAICNILVTYNDVKLAQIGCVTKIMRTWTVLEWSCSTPQRKLEYIQMIEIADTKAPTITGLKDLTVSTSPHKCEAVVVIPPYTVKDNCTATADIKVTISGGIPFINANGGTTTLSVGEHKLYIRAIDNCGNTRLDSINVWVEDNTPPVAVCDQNTVVGLTSDGTAWVHATTFDDGSYDECKLAKMLVRRMDHTNCQPCATPEFPGFHFIGSRDGHYYYFSQHPLNARLAYKHAKALGGYVGSFETKAEYDWFDALVREKHPEEDYLIGLSGPNEDHLTWESGKPYTGWINFTTKLVDYNYYAYSFEGYLGLDGGNEATRYVVEIDDPCGFSSYVKFCCADIPTNVMVQFRVIDAACNWNDCMVNATVQDKLPPRIICPDDRTVNCDVAYDEKNLGAAFGTATSVDNCTSTPTETFTSDLNQCRIGLLTRTFTATDAGGRKAECKQKIYFEPVKPFYCNHENPKDPNDDVIWPVDVEVAGCANPAAPEFAPDRTGKPVFLNVPCSLVGADYDDKIFTFNNSLGNACFKILRTWTIIDWCQFKGGQYYTCSYTQTIKVNNTIKPEIISNCARKSAKTYDTECIDGYIELTASAKDDCTVGLKWTAKIDLKNDGSFESGLTKNGTGTSATQANPTVAIASGTYPIGSHRVQWTFEDKCGNITTCDQLFDVVNAKAPVPYLLNGLAVDLMPVDNNNDGKIDGGMIELWAKDFDNGSYHSCPGYKVLLSFTPNINVKNKVFTCADKGRQNVRIYASIITPAGDTVQSWANTFVDIQDNMKVCSTGVNGTKVVVNGKVMTESQVGVYDASLILEGTETQIVKSNSEGAYDFGSMPTGGTYVLRGAKNDDYINGISTLDLVHIQRHILGIEKIKSPYLILAADVNNDKKITAADLIELRKLILGVAVNFTNTSWRFIDNNYAFPDPSNPFGDQVKETYDIDPLNTDMSIDFVGVKIGDVNGSVKANLSDKAAEPRSPKSLVLKTNEGSFNAGENVKVTLTLDQIQMLNGLQMTLGFDASAAQLIAINGLDITTTEQNFGMTRLGEGLVSMSWNAEKAVSVNEAFAIEFKALKSGKIAQLLNINSSISVSEAYNTNLEVMPIELRTVAPSGYELYQNTPNPFNGNTTIAFTIPVDSKVEFKVMDVTGKVIKQINRDYTSGTHSITLDKSQLGQSGVLYYQIAAGEFTATKKMVVIE